MTTINVVGSGLAGSILTRLLRQNGMTVRLFDDGDPHSASRASSNLFISSWLKKFTGWHAAEGIVLLEQMFHGKINQPFSSGIADAMKVRHIAQQDILVAPDRTDSVVQVLERGVRTQGGTFDGLTVLCTGHRGQELVGAAMPRVESKVGHCYLIRGDLTPGSSRLGLVSPYTHEKLYQLRPGVIYYADSVSVQPETYRKRYAELQARTWERLQRLMPVRREDILEMRIGKRPVIEYHDFGFASEIALNVWALNGGGKNGMVAYASAATRILSMLRERMRNA